MQWSVARDDQQPAAEGEGVGSKIWEKAKDTAHTVKVVAQEKLKQAAHNISERTAAQEEIATTAGAPRVDDVIKTSSRAARKMEEEGRDDWLGPEQVNEARRAFRTEDVRHLLHHIRMWHSL